MTVKVIPISNAYRDNWERIFMKDRGDGTVEVEPCTAVICGPVVWVLEDGLDYKGPERGGE